MEDKVISDLKDDIILSIDSAYAEYKNPSRNLIIENIRGVFLATEVYNFPELKKQIEKAIEFQYPKDSTPEKEVLSTMVESVFMSWRVR